jgi:hypothetical protein
MKKYMLLLLIGCLCPAVALGTYIEIAPTLTVWINDVEIIPTQPSDIDMIRLNISGQASGFPSRVAFGNFSQNGTSLQLDLHLDIGMLTMVSEWMYSKEMQALAPATYSMEVRAFANYDGTLQDTYPTVYLTVVPEPAALTLLGIALPFIRVRRTKEVGSR